MNLKKVCGWCEKHFGGSADAPVSHGICPPCFEQHFPEEYQREVSRDPPSDNAAQNERGLTGPPPGA